jgi:hypothetical protein
MSMDLVRQVVFRGKLLDDWHELGVHVARHGREQVVLQLEDGANGEAIC